MYSNKVIQSAKWMIGCKIIQSLLQFVVGMLSARYLGPSNYGLVSYAASIVAFAVPVMQLGLSDTLVQDYVNGKYQESQILGTSLVMNIVSGIACMIGVTSFAAVANPGEPVTVAICALYSTSLLFQAVEMTKYWFHAKLYSKYSSLAALAAYIAVSAYKLYLLACGHSVYWFALSHSVEYGVTGAVMISVYWHLEHKKLSFSFAVAKTMFSRSRYYIMANLMVTVFQNVGHVLLKQFVSDAENGFFTAAITCYVITSFVYAAIMDSVRPVILESKRQSQRNFEQNIARLYGAIIYMALVQSIAYTLLAKPIIVILYGSEYLPAVSVLRILAWQAVFSNMGTVRNIWILGEGAHSVLWKINLSGAVANVILNALLIPRWGACGAALASVGTQFFTNFVMGFILKPIRENNRLLLRGFNPRLLVELFQLFMRKYRY